MTYRKLRYPLRTRLLALTAVVGLALAASPSWSETINRKPSDYQQTLDRLVVLATIPMVPVACMGGTPKIALTINANSNTPYNIFTAAGSPGYAVSVTLLVTGNAVQGSTSTATAAIDTGTGWNALSTLSLSLDAGSTVSGKGGIGGDGSSGGNPNGTPGGGGQDGGPAINLQFPLAIAANNGTIQGGGGGGVGGTNRWNGAAHAGGGGGGGGAGAAGGVGGTLGSGGTGGGPGATGTLTAGGVAGLGRTAIIGCVEADGDFGSNGGGPGLAGASDANHTNPGGPGYCIKRNGNALTGKGDGTYSDANWKGQIGT